jgi:hypothetical protein
MVRLEKQRCRYLWCTKVSIVKLRRAIVEWLSPLNFFATQDDIFSRGQKGTGQWLLESSEFRDWFSGSRKILWCPGIRMNESNGPTSSQPTC